MSERSRRRGAVQVAWAVDFRWWLASVGCVVGCAAAVVPEPLWAEPRPGEFVIASSAPPFPRVEQVPPQTSKDSVWVRGYPHWDGRRWTFRQGGWERKRPGERLTRWHWDVDGEGRFRYWPPHWTKDTEELEEPQ